MKISKNESLFGFTLIEVVIVIGIIAILTVIIFPAVNAIRAKNRDAEKIADIASIQLALSFYYNQKGGYPTEIKEGFAPTFVPFDSLSNPSSSGGYSYIPLKKGNGTKCTFYHLGVELELANAQIDLNDTFDSRPLESSVNNEIKSGGYSYCDDDYDGPGLAPPTSILHNYNVHP